MPNDETLLQEIRDNYDYGRAEWRHVYDNGDVDANFAAGNPWPPEELAQRQAVGRPACVLDELGQYINQAINNLRANKRGVKLDPEGRGTDEKTAYYNEGRIRQIENKSKAQSAYIGMFDSMIVRGFGFCKLKAEFVNPDDFNQEMRVERVADPNTILIDPDFKKADASDMKWAFELSKMSLTDFLRAFPHAEKRSFNEDDARVIGPEWYDGKNLIIANYWRQECEYDTLFELDSQVLPTIKESELPQGAKVKRDVLVIDGAEVPIIRKRKTETKRCKVYQTNGFEILSEADWPDPAGEVPIIVGFGKEIYADVGDYGQGRNIGAIGGRRRHFESLIRKARDAFMAYCYARTNQLEFTAMIPKVPAVVYKGQLDNCAGWDTAHRIPQAYLEVNAQTEATGDMLLPMPSPRQYDASPIAIMGQLCEEFKRAIQSAFGMYNASVGRQDSNAKSGVAIERLDQQSQEGNFHFIDNFDRALERLYTIMDRMIPVYDDTPGERAIREKDDTAKKVTVMPSPQPGMPPAAAQEDAYQVSRDNGFHGVVVSTGPSYKSQREEAASLTDSLVANPAIVQTALQANPAAASKIFGTAIRLRNLGPLGEEIADAIDPPDKEDIPPQAQQAIQKAQQEAQAIDALAKKLQGENEELKRKLEGRESDNDTKLQIAELQASVDLLKNHENNATKASIEQLWAQMERIQAMLGAHRDSMPEQETEQEQPEPDEVMS